MRPASRALLLNTDNSGEPFCGCPWLPAVQSLLFGTPQGSPRSLPRLVTGQALVWSPPQPYPQASSPAPTMNNGLC